MIETMNIDIRSRSKVILITSIKKAKKQKKSLEINVII